MKGHFPDNFIWGASTSPHQVEGDNFYNDWWEWEQAGHTEPSGKACDQYHRFREDFRIAKGLGHNAHRLGIEWSRLEKEEGKWDQSEWDHYKEVLDSLLDLGMEPFLTLHHFTIPTWLSRKGGWLNDDSVRLFARFAEKAAKELSSRVRYWITINEPNIIAFLPYYMGIWPPCHKNFGEAKLALKNMLKGHVEAYRLIKENAANDPGAKRPEIGIAKAVTAFHPCSPASALDRFATHLRARLHNYCFINSSLKGRILIPGLRPERLSAKGAMDFIGLNYYFRQFIHHTRPFGKDPLGEVCSLEHHPDAGPTTDMGWEVYPEGMYEVVKKFCHYRLPIMITENGIGTTDDSRRTDYIREHLRQLLRAMDEGAPVKGYLHWSLLDNFEWAEGYSKRFGLVGVDFNTQERTIKDSARYYESVIRSGKIL